MSRTASGGMTLRDLMEELAEDGVGGSDRLATRYMERRSG
jgi:hypothetical protein